jgi:hypothetical protein
MTAGAATRIYRTGAWVLIGLLAGFTAACATKSPSTDTDKEIPEADTLGAAVRAFGEQGASLVLMNGLEKVRVDADAVAGMDAANAAPELAKMAGCAVQATAHYAFLYPGRDPYDVLATLSVEGRLDPAYGDTTASIAFGAGTPLFTAMAMLGRALNHTFVVDNTLAEAECGELALSGAPLASVLEAVLKSARVAEFRIESTEEFVLISGPANAAPQTALLNGAGLGDAARAVLDRRANVFLPARSQAPAGVVMTPGAETLGAAAETLSAQLGVPVTVQHGLEELPVMPMIAHDVRIATALDLLIRQWPVPQFGYEAQPDRILIRRRTASDAPVPVAPPAPPQP